MKQLFFNLILLLPAFAYGQAVEYSIDMVQKDSFFLVEKFTAAPTSENPRGQEVITYMLFNSMGALLDFANTGLEAAEKDLKEAQEKAAVLGETKKRLLQIRALTDKKRP